MPIYSIKPAFQKRLMGLRDACIRSGISADALTFAALGSSAIGAACVALSPTFRWLLVLVPFFAITRLAFNALDGMVALETRTARPFGEVLNESLDRVSDVIWFVGLAFVVDPLLSIGTLVIVLLVSYVGTVAKAAGGIRIYSGLMGKADRMIVLSAGAIGALFVDVGYAFDITVLLVGLGAVITFFQRLLAARRALRP